jgi:WD40 repeat protein
MNGMRKSSPWRFPTTIWLMLLVALIPVACGSTQTHSTPTPVATEPGTTLYVLRAPAGINAPGSVAWSPDGKYIASAAEDRAVQVWDAKTGATLVTYMPHAYNVDTSISSVAWSPDGKYIASQGYPDGSVQVWDAKTGATLVTYKGHSGYAGTVAWSPDGEYIASSGADKTIQIWEAQNGHLLYTYRGQAVGSLAWSPDGKYIASASIGDGTIWIWQAI